MGAKIALVVDHPIRDLGGLTLVATELASRGADVYLVPMAFQAREIFAIAPELAVLNYLRKTNAALVDRIMDAGIGFSLMDTEGGFYGDLSKYTQILNRDPAQLGAVRSVFAWGHKMDRYWREEIRLKPSQIALTGAPRFDLYSQKHRAAMLEFLPAEWKSRRDPLVLLNTKVSVANPQFITREAEIKLYTETLGIPMSEVEWHIEQGEKAIRDACEITLRLARKFADTAVMIRPHPHERMQTYAEGVAGGPSNVEVRRDGTVTPWIARSCAMIHRHCTTAIESALAGVPAIAPQWMASSANVPDGEAVSVPARTWEELEDIVDACRKGNYAPPEAARARLDSIVHDWLYRMDGESGARVAQAILDTLPSKSPVRADRARCALYEAYADRTGAAGRGFHALNRLSRFSRIAEPVWQVERARQAKWARTPKGFGQSDVDAFVRALGMQDRVRVGGEVETLDGYPSVAVRVSPSGRKG